MALSIFRTLILDSLDNQNLTRGIDFSRVSVGKNHHDGLEISQVRKEQQAFIHNHSAGDKAFIIYQFRRVVFGERCISKAAAVLAFPATRLFSLQESAGVLSKDTGVLEGADHIEQARCYMHLVACVNRVLATPRFSLLARASEKV